MLVGEQRAKKKQAFGRDISISCQNCHYCFIVPLHFDELDEGGGGGAGEKQENEALYTPGEVGKNTRKIYLTLLNPNIKK